MVHFDWSLPVLPLVYMGFCLLLLTSQQPCFCIRFSLSFFSNFVLVFFSFSYVCSLCSAPAPGGHICLNEQLLHYLHTLASKGYIHVRIGLFIVY